MLKFVIPLHISLSKWRCWLICARFLMQSLQLMTTRCYPFAQFWYQKTLWILTQHCLVYNGGFTTCLCWLFVSLAGRACSSIIFHANNLRGLIFRCQDYRAEIQRLSSAYDAIMQRISTRDGDKESLQIAEIQKTNKEEMERLKSRMKGSWLIWLQKIYSFYILSVFPSL